jgi:hypothetical protein
VGQILPATSPSAVLSSKAIVGLGTGKRLMNFAGAMNAAEAD